MIDLILYEKIQFNKMYYKTFLEKDANSVVL